MKLNTFKASRPETFEFELSDYMPVRSVKQAEETMRNMSKYFSEISVSLGAIRLDDEKGTIHHYLIEKNKVHRVRTTYGADLMEELLEAHKRIFVM